ncbi:hypothetical protein ACPA9J_12240 [Pseudomonas aeruginosa]
MATLAGVFSVAYSLRFIHDVFFNGEPARLPKFPPHEPPRYMKVPGGDPVFLCLLVGMLPAYTGGAAAGRRRQCQPWRATAGIQPGDLARFQPAIADERGGAGWRCAGL